MKMRKITIWVLACLLLASMAFGVSGSQAMLNYVTDEAELFSDGQAQALERRAEAISREYDFGVYIITVPDFTEYTEKNSIARFGMELYDEYDLGFGEDREGCFLILSMAERDYYLGFHSSRANAVFTETGRDRMEERFLNYFRRDDYAGGYHAFLDTCEEYLNAAGNGAPVGQDEDGEDAPSPALALIPGAIVAGLVALFTCAPMRSAGQKRDADDYMTAGGLHLNRRSDMFLHRTVTRTPRNTEQSSSGGSYHHSSGSHSGRSGKF